MINGEHLTEDVTWKYFEVARTTTWAISLYGQQLSGLLPDWNMADVDIAFAVQYPTSKPLTLDSQHFEFNFYSPGNRYSSHMEDNQIIWRRRPPRFELTIKGLHYISEKAETRLRYLYRAAIAETAALIDLLTDSNNEGTSLFTLTDKYTERVLIHRNTIPLSALIGEGEKFPKLGWVD